MLGAYRLLHRTCSQVFAGDTLALQQSRIKIKESFLVNKNAKPQQVEDLVISAKETSEFLLQGVLQAQLSSNNVYKVKITEKTKLFDNAMLKEPSVVDLMSYEVPEKYQK